MHDAEVHCAGTDVDDHGVVERAEAIGNGKRLGYHHQFFGMFAMASLMAILLTLRASNPPGNGNGRTSLRYPR
jgi:hypothetical protein